MLLDQLRAAPLPSGGLQNQLGMQNSTISTVHVQELMAFSGYFTEAPGITSMGDENSTISEGIHGTPQYNFTVDSSTREPVELITAVIAGVCLSFIICMTIGGNVLVLLAVFVNSHLRSTTNYFIVNLAIADLLLGTTVLPFSATLEIIKYWAFGQIFCDVWAAVDVLCCTASIMSLCVISIDRYIGVTRPLQHSTIMTEKRALYIIILVWILSMAISVAPLFGWKEPPPEDPSICEVTQQVGYVLFSVSGSFYIPLAIILVVYFRVYREAMNQSRFLTTGIKKAKSSENNHEVTLRIHTGRQPNATKPAHQSSSSSEHSEGSSRKAHSRLTLAGKMAKFKREKKAAKTLGIVVGVFILCWLPFFFLLPLASLCSRCHIPDWLFKIIFWLGYCNSMMNPIIYACSSKEFKRAFARILKCQLRRRPRTFQGDRGHLATELSKMERYLPFTSLRSRSQVRRSSTDEAGNQPLMERPCSARRRFERESPIASLRLLHNTNRHTTMDTVLSDEEGDVTDDEKSDISVDAETKSHLDRLVRECGAPQPETRENFECNTAGNPGALQIPDIVINDMSDTSNAVNVSKSEGHDDLEANTPVKNRSALHHGGFYQPSDDNIMWL